jgi:Bifunctional DNA primase/polymerase, N-terminal/Primase C terminal 1 (PriCT-1)
MNCRLASSTQMAQQVTSEGIFTKWQPHYAEKQIPTFPVGNDKKPQIRRWNQIGLSGSARLAQRFRDANAIGFQVGPRSQITVLDIDTDNEGILADALSEHGETPFLVRTGGGYHAYYRYSGEHRRVRPYANKPIDVLGGGYVVAPPSLSGKGQYQIIAGSLDDLGNLSPLHAMLDRVRTEARIEEGRRNNTIFRLALEQARHCDTFETLLDVMRTRNMDCEPPLAEDVITSTARSAWRYEQEGRNLVGRGRSVMTPHSVVDELIGENQDAFVLLSLLQRHHWGRSFVLANAMADQLGWTRKRFADARKFLLERGYLRVVRASGFRFPPLFRLVAWGGQN